MRCECGRKPVNDAGICESCHYNRQGVTVDAGSSQFKLIGSLKAEAHVFGYESMLVEMDKVYEELKWTAKEK